MKVSSIKNLSFLNFSAILLTALIISSCNYLIKNNISSRIKEIKIQKEIINSYSKSILKEPKNEQLIFDRGIARYEYGDYKEAINDFD